MESFRKALQDYETLQVKIEDREGKIKHLEGKISMVHSETKYWEDSTWKAKKELRDLYAKLQKPDIHFPIANRKQWRGVIRKLEKEDQNEA